MPKRNNNKRSQNQIARLRRNNGLNFHSTIPNMIYSNTFPREMKVKLVYFQTGYHTTSSGGVPYDYQFRLNSIFDPDYTSTGHQPLGYDQYAAFFNRYRVDSALVNASFSCDVQVQCTLLCNNSQASITAQSEGEESPLSSTKMFTPGMSCNINRHFDLPIVNGVTKTVYESDDRYQSLFSANPTEVLNLHVLTTVVDNSSKNVFRSVKITYYVTLFDPIQLTLS